jgi:hypothetical protein
MTTDDRHTDAAHSPDITEPPKAATGHAAARSAVQTAGGGATAELATDEPQQSTANSNPSATLADSAVSDTTGQDTMTRDARTQAESTTEWSLFADDELTELRERWQNVQAGFVDDPRDCVQKVDGLVSDVVDRLETGFADARSRLEQQWARGEEASTEDLRLALKRYREFFQRLLAV